MAVGGPAGGAAAAGAEAFLLSLFFTFPFPFPLPLALMLVLTLAPVPLPLPSEARIDAGCEEEYVADGPLNEDDGAGLASASTSDPDEDAGILVWSRV